MINYLCNAKGTLPHYELRNVIKMMYILVNNRLNIDPFFILLS